MPIRDVEIGKRYEGTVERVTNYGAYVDIGAERLGFLHVAAIWGRRPRETLEQLRIGESVWVNVDDVDEIRSHIRLRARGRRHTELRKDGPLGELARMEGDDQADGQEVVIRQAVQRPWSERDEEEDKDGTDEENYEDEDFEDMYEREIEDDMFSDLELLPKDITNMIDGNDEHYDITHFQ
ncbi:unnamed protein product [Chondrus crispus]|uniref:S1 motif domain-containing protein n=1 Tax=Chondrus crispus TaxID=2769 RepID=R7QIP7_CHOCR|nr:unnamed protein product [Chondrus crispus]CDF37351.1 unnamed protein product [Chondrus crispus]|eukprot:XP_005717170.1 unnamed protein product [Chondrus crispus]